MDENKLKDLLAHIYNHPTLLDLDEDDFINQGLSYANRKHPDYVLLGLTINHGPDNINHWCTRRCILISDWKLFESVNSFMIPNPFTEEIITVTKEEVIRYVIEDYHRVASHCDRPDKVEIVDGVLLI